MEWGLCKDCKWWQIEPGAPVSDHTMGMCIDEDIYPFLIRISGNGGCNRFVDGAPAVAKGSSDAPPTATPTR
jgi:hypothetical protein